MNRSGELERNGQPHISFSADGQWWCQRGIKIGIRDTVAEAWAGYDRHARQIVGAA